MPADGVEKQLGAVFDELVELVQETKQAEWSAPTENRRERLERVKRFLGEQAVAVAEAERRLGDSPPIKSPTAHRSRNLAAAAEGNAGRILELLVADLLAVADDLRHRSATADTEWREKFLELADELDVQIAALRKT